MHGHLRNIEHTPWSWLKVPSVPLVVPQCSESETEWKYRVLQHHSASSLKDVGTQGGGGAIAVGVPTLDELPRKASLNILSCLRNPMLIRYSTNALNILWASSMSFGMTISGCNPLASRVTRGPHTMNGQSLIYWSYWNHAKNVAKFTDVRVSKL